MKKEQEAIYEAYFEMFRSKGWELYLDTVKDEIESVTTKVISDARTEVDLGKAQGAIHYLKLVLALENTIESMYEETLREAKDDGNYVKKIEDSE
tara:strand:+ start:288 stop:572 length:285 start_codon:yes stop_codon:yes gene_type:complete